MNTTVSVCVKESFLEIACRNARRSELEKVLKEINSLTETEYWIDTTDLRKLVNHLEKRLGEMK